MVNNTKTTQYPMLLRHGDCFDVLKQMPTESVHCCITSPPYWGLRDYGIEGQLGLEKTPEEYVAKIVAIFDEVRRVLRNDGTLWLNMGDSYANVGKSGESSVDRRVRETSLKPKDLVGIPWRVAFALQADGWTLRQDIIWHKRSPMPESVTDRCVKAHEYLFLFSKNKRYYFDNEAIKEPASTGSNRSSFTRGKTADVANRIHAVGQKERHDYATRNKRSVWSLSSSPFKGAHFAVMPPKSDVRGSTVIGWTIFWG